MALMVSVLAADVLADGLPLKAGRYPGAVLEIRLSDEQKDRIDHFRTCHLANFRTMNIYTPYVIRLTDEQARVVREHAGFSPRWFEVYETYGGFNEAGPHWNLLLRFSEDKAEIPLDLLVQDDEAKAAHEVQGWKVSNPCFPEVGKE